MQFYAIIIAIALSAGGLYLATQSAQDQAAQRDGVEAAVSDRSRAYALRALRRQLQIDPGYLDGVAPGEPVPPRILRDLEFGGYSFAGVRITR